MATGIRLLVIGVQMKPDCVTDEHAWDVTSVCAEQLGTKDAALRYTAIKNVVNCCAVVDCTDHIIMN